jgi:hypothetical protein
LEACPLSLNSQLQAPSAPYDIIISQGRKAVLTVHAAADETVLFDMRKLFLDEKENSFVSLLEAFARQERTAQLVRSQLDLFKERNGEESHGVQEMETRLNLAENALHDLRSEWNETVEKIAAGRSEIHFNL